jgi:small subunit ribosomal protein S9
MEKEPKTRYIEAVGRRKTSIARARAIPAAKNSVTINEGKSVNDYFITETQKIVAMESLNKSPTTFSITAKIKGGGINSQAEALRHAIARILIKYNPQLRKDLKKAGFLCRDQRAKERRKFGLKKARKAPQWSKR